MSIMKLKYDFAIKHCRVRILNSKILQFKRLEWIRRISVLKSDLELFADHIHKFTKMCEFWEKHVNDVKSKVENQQARDKTVDKQFKQHYLNTVPSQYIHELNKLFKKRYKITQKSFNSPLICNEVAQRLTSKTSRLDFPLPQELGEYLRAIEVMDEFSTNAPHQFEAKLWDTFVKLRRQKIENELRLRALSFLLLDAQNCLSLCSKDLAYLKSNRENIADSLESTVNEYYETIHDRSLQITLTMGQVEIAVGGHLSSMKSAILMNVDDVNNVNDQIREAGEKKIKAMKRVAFFRRKVIFKEWEHRVVSANIDYLRYMLHIIEKCKVTMEFLHILRNWDKYRRDHEKNMEPGILERVTQQRIDAFRKNLDRILEKISIAKADIEEIRVKNQLVNRQIDECKVDVAMLTANRDFMGEEKNMREREGRMSKIKYHRALMDTIRRDYATILELSTILELQRLRTYPTLGPSPSQCLY